VRDQNIWLSKELGESWKASRIRILRTINLEDTPPSCVNNELIKGGGGSESAQGRNEVKSMHGQLSIPLCVCVCSFTH
jgi:hypothetical protein